MKKQMIIGAMALLGMMMVGHTAKAQEEVELKEYCTEYEQSDSDALRGRGVGESRKQQQARNKCRAAALEELGEKIGLTLRMYAKDYNGSIEVNDDEDFMGISNRISERVVNQSFGGFKTVCEKATTYTNAKGVKMYKYYMVLEFDKNKMEKAVYDGLSQEGALKAGYNFAQFQKDFDKAFEQERAQE